MENTIVRSGRLNIVVYRNKILWINIMMLGKDKSVINGVEKFELPVKFGGGKFVKFDQVAKFIPNAEREKQKYMNIVGGKV